MPPKHKGVKLSLHELAQELGGTSIHSYLPSHSSGVDCERPDRSGGDWRPDRGTRGDKDERKGDREDFQNNGAADGDFDWRAGAVLRETAHSGETNSFRSRDADEAFTRDRMPLRCEPNTSRQAGSMPEGRGYDTSRGYRAGDDVDFGNVRSGGAHKLGPSIPNETRPLRSSATSSSAWGRDARSAGTTVQDDIGDWRSKERVDTRPDSLKNRFKQRPATAIPSFGELEKRAGSAGAEITQVPPSYPDESATTSDKAIRTQTPSATELSATTSKEESPGTVTPPSSELKLPSPLPPTKAPTTAEDRARGLLLEVDVTRPSFSKDEVPLLEPIVLKKRTASSVTASSTPFRPSRRRPGSSALDELVKKKEAEAVAAAATALTQTQIEDKKVAYRRNLQEREQKRRKEEERRRLEREEEERERLVTEKLMTADPQKMKRLQNNIKAGLEAVSEGATLLSQLKSTLTDADLESFVPSIVIAKCLVVHAIETLEPMWDASLAVADSERLESIAGVVRALKPTLAFLFAKSGIRRHKLKFLLQIQRLVHAAGFPRVSEGLALIEAIWDSLYIEDVIEEQYYEMWYEATDDDTPGRCEMLFQMLTWFTWLQNAVEEGQPEGDDEEDEDEEDDF